MNNNERMISNSPEKGRQRYQVIRDAISRYNEAIKAGYYLEHDDERRRIADNACRKIRQSYTFRQKLEYMLNMAN